jgi:hypothetical protein
MLARVANLSSLTNLRERRTMSRRTQTSVSFWKCGHFSPVLVEAVEGGKRAQCLLCGERGEVREGAEEALRALRDRVHQRHEAQSA